MKNSITLLLTLVVIATGFAAGGAIGAEPPHPYHVSLAEVNWNAKSQKFEVALCLWPADLEKALAQQTGRPIDLEKEANVDRLMEAYIAKRFTIHSTNKQTEPKQTTPLASTSNTASASQALTPAGSSTNAPTDSASSQASTATKNRVLAPPAPINIATNTAKSNSSAQPPKMKWYGHEADAKQVWLYFEIEGNPQANWTAENRVFFELNDDQLNHVQWNGSGKTETLVCNADNARIVLPKK